MATWRDQVALVTGGGRGIGRAIARRLAREGASVCVNYLSRADAAESLVADIIATGGRAIAVAADVADDAAVEGMVDRVAAAFGPVTILVNNAGVSFKATLESYDPEKLERMRQVNGKQVKYFFNYKEAIAGKHPEQNIALQNGDTIYVP